MIDNNEEKTLDSAPEAELTLDSLAASLSAVSDGETHSKEEASESNTASSTTDEDAGETQQKLTVKATAEKLGISAKELYENLMIDLGESQSMSLSQLKDRGKDLQQSDSLIAKVAENKLATENELLAKRQMLNRQAERMGYQFSQEDQQAIQQESQAYRQGQVNLAFELMPDWTDETVRNNQIQSIKNLVTEYSFSEAEQGLFIDARLLKILRDYSSLRDTVKTLSKEYKKPKHKQARRSDVTANKQKVENLSIDDLGKLL